MNARLLSRALISLLFFGMGSLLLFFMIWKAEKLTALGLTGKLYYIVLLPLGLSVAGFLFGVLESYASYRGQQLGGTLRLSGPIIAFLLVVILGFVLVPDPSTFPITAYVHGPGGIQDIVLSNSGEVFIDLDGDRRHVQIGDQGQAYFPAIPANFRGQSVPLWVSSNLFESADLTKKLKLDSPKVYLPVRRKSWHISGRVESNDPNCVAGAQLHVSKFAIPVDAVSGNFQLDLPSEANDEDLDIEATGPGCEMQRYKIVPNAGFITVLLSKGPNPAKK